MHTAFGLFDIELNILLAYPLSLFFSLGPDCFAGLNVL